MKCFRQSAKGQEANLLVILNERQAWGLLYFDVDQRENVCSELSSASDSLNENWPGPGREQLRESMQPSHS